MLITGDDVRRPIASARTRSTSSATSIWTTWSSGRARFKNELIIASHFSTRLHPDQIQRIVEKSLPDSLRGRLKIWL